MESNTIKIKKMFYSYMKEKIWLEEKSLEGYKLRNITMGYIFEFEKIEPTRLVYEIERFDLPSQPSLSDIQKKEQFMEMAEETGWEIVTWDEALTYYLCKPYDEHDSNELYNDEESRIYRASRFRSVYLEMGRSLLGFALAINVIMFLLFALADFSITESFTKFYLVFTLVYSIFVISIQFVYKKLADDIYADLCMSLNDWKKKFDYTRENVKKCRKIFVRSKALIKFLNKQAEEGWYLSEINMFSYTFSRENPLNGTPIYYAVENKSTLSRRLNQSGQTLEKTTKDINNMGFAWMQQSVKNATLSGLQYICAFHRQFAVYASQDNDTAKNFQKKGIAVGWMSSGIVWFILASALIGGIVGFIAGILL